MGVNGRDPWVKADLKMAHEYHSRPHSHSHSHAYPHSHRGGELITLPLGALPRNAPSIFINYVSPRVTKAAIMRAIQDTWGIPSQIKLEFPEGESEAAGGGGGAQDMELEGDVRDTAARREIGGKAYVTMDTWYKTPIAREARLGLLRKEMIKLHLSNGFYFKCFILIDRHGI